VIPLSQDRGEIKVDDVLAASIGVERDEMIHQWCVAVWEVFRDNEQVIENFLLKHNIL